MINLEARGRVRIPSPVKFSTLVIDCRLTVGVFVDLCPLKRKGPHPPSYLTKSWEAQMGPPYYCLPRRNKYPWVIAEIVMTILNPPPAKGLFAPLGIPLQSTYRPRLRVPSHQPRADDQDPQSHLLRRRSIAYWLPVTLGIT